MFLKDKNSGDLIEILNLQDLFDPFQVEVVGRYQQGYKHGYKWKKSKF